MKIRYCSDLHVDLNTKYYGLTDVDIMQKLNLYNIDLLILAGDTAEYPQNLKFCDMVLRMYPELHIVEIPGNHLYYSCVKLFMSMDEIDFCCKQFAKDNKRYTFLNNDTFIHKGIKIIGSTLWTKLGERLSYINEITSSLNDFRRIYNDKYEFISSNDIIKQCEKSRKFIIKEINNSELPTIVVTHHAPFFEYYSSVSHAFGIDLSNTFKRLKKYPDYWIYGHTHINKDKKLEFKRGCIQCLCNQFGYFSENQYGSQFNAWKTFNSNKEIDI